MPPISWIIRFAIAALVSGFAITPAAAHHPWDLAANTDQKNHLRIIDGDTVVVGKTHVRAQNYDTPEKGALAKCDAERQLAVRANARFTQLASPPHVFTLKWGKGKDKFGRGLAKFYSDHTEIGPILIAEGLAKPYDGGTKASWCN